MERQTGRGVSRQPALQGLRQFDVRERHAMDRNENRKRRKEDEMSEEFKCPYCEGIATVAYNNLLYCHDCKRTFSERDAKIMKQAVRIAELEAERDHFREVAEKLVWLYSDEHKGRLDNGLRIDGFYSHEWLGMILDMAREAMKGAEK